MTEAAKQEVTVASEKENYLSSHAGKLVDRANSMTPVDDESLAECVDLTKLIKEHIKSVDCERRLIVDPLNQVVKHVNGRFKTITDPLDAAERIVKGKILDFQREQQRKAREAAEAEQKRLEEERLAEAARLEAEGDKVSAEVAFDRLEKTTVKPVEYVAPSGGMTGAKSTITKKWKARVTDIAALAGARPECVSANDMVIMTLFRAGVKDIPGVEFYQEESVSIR